MLTTLQAHQISNSLFGLTGDPDDVRSALCQLGVDPECGTTQALLPLLKTIYGSVFSVPSACSAWLSRSTFYSNPKMLANGTITSLPVFEPLRSVLRFPDPAPISSIFTAELLPTHIKLWADVVRGGHLFDDGLDIISRMGDGGQLDVDTHAECGMWVFERGKLQHQQLFATEQGPLLLYNHMLAWRLQDMLQVRLPRLLNFCTADGLPLLNI